MKQLMRNVLFILLICLIGQLSAEISVQIGYGTTGNSANGYPTPSATSVYNGSSTSPADSLLTGTTSNYRSNLRLLMQAGTYSQPPNPAILKFPENQATWFTDPILRWQSGGGVVDSYDLYLGTENPPPFLFSTNEPNYSANLAPGTTYYWKVEPRNQYGTSPSSEIRSFRTAAADELAESFEGEPFPPPAWLPVQSYARDSSRFYHGAFAAGTLSATYSKLISTPLLNIQSTDSFEFRISAFQSGQYQILQLYSSPDRITWQPIGTEQPLALYPSFSYIKQELVGLSGLYYLGIGVLSLQGSRSISIDAVFGPQLAAVAPQACELYAPVLGMVGLPQTPVLKWRPATDGGIPSSYTVYLDENPQPQTLIGTTTDCHLEVNLPLVQGQTYYWKVVAHNQYGAALASEYSWFKVGDPPLISSFPWQETFGEDTYSTFPLPNWEKLTGALVDNTSLVSGGNWSEQQWLLTGVQPNLAASSIATSTCNSYDWLFTPWFDLGTGDYELEFDLALVFTSSYDGHYPTAHWERFAVLIGNGEQWGNANVLRMWDNQGSDDVYEQISATGSRIRINLAGYTGINRLAFYSTAEQGQLLNNLMIDNITIRQLPDTPICTISPQNCQFGTVNQGTMPTQAFTVQNTGAEPLLVSSIVVNGSPAFTMRDLPTLPLTLGIGDSLTCVVQFTPWDELYHVATVEITDNRMLHTVQIDGRGHNGTLYTLPYSENWDSLPNHEFHFNWQRFVSATYPVTEIDVSLGSPASPPCSMSLNESSFDNCTLILSSPYIHPLIALHTIRLSFMLRGSYADIVQLGTISDPYNPATFNSLTSYSIVPEWQSHEFDFSSYYGTDRFIAFRYIAGSSGHAVYLDDLVFAAMPVNDLSVVSFTGNNTPTMGIPNAYQVLVRNSGSEAQTAYTLKLYAEDVLLAQAAGSPLAAGEQVLIDVDWTPQNVWTGYLRAYIDLATDEDAANNYSTYLPIDVLPEGQISVTVGSGNELAAKPVSFAYQGNLYQTLIYPEELGATGSITRITLYNSFETSVLNTPLSIWLGTTDLPDLSAGLVSSEGLWEVYSGNLDFPAGEHTIQISLDNPYPYTGGNLVLMVFRPQDTQTYPGENMFKCQTLGSNRGRYYGSFINPIDICYPPKGYATNQFPQVSFLISPFTSETNLLIQPTEVNFGNCYVHTHQTKQFKLLNRSSQAWQLNSLALTGDAAFSLSEMPILPQSLELGEALSVTVNYAPQNPGNHSSALTFTDSQRGRTQFGITISASATDASISALPYIQNFDAVTMPNLPSGFGKLVQSNGSDASVATSTYNTPYSSPNCISLRDNPTNTSSTVMLLLPPVADNVSIRDVRISFLAKFVSNPTSIRIGATGSLSDPTAFVSLATFALTYDWRQYTATIAAYQGSGRQIALALNNIAATQYACVDSIVVEYLAAKDLAAVALSGKQTPVSDAEELYEVSVFNWGSMLQDSYQVKLCNLEGAELASAAGLPVGGGQTVVVSVPLAVSNASPVKVYGKVVLAMDADLTNNESPLLSIYPIPLNAVGITVGAGNQLERIPVDMYYSSSLFETIYTAEELSNQSGSITGICFYNSFTEDILQKQTQIWLGTTAQSDLAAGWIPASQLYQVYNSFPDYPSGQNVIALNFPIPFPYDGSQNLVMLIMRPLEMFFYSSSDVFFSQTVGSNRSRKVQSNSDIYNPEFPPAVSTLNGRFPKTTFMIVPNACGTIAGTVSDAADTPLNGAQVNILNTEFTAVTDASGYFSFSSLPAGVYHLLCTKHGYHNANVELELSPNEQDTLAITLNPLPVVNVSGRVIAGESGAIVGSAIIVLNGYQDYQAEMPQQGLFVIDGVYANQNYSYQISANGYAPLTGIVEIGSEDYLWPDLALGELLLPPCNLQASIIEAPAAVLVSWELSDSLSYAKKTEFSRSRNMQRMLSGYLVWRMRSEMQNLPQNWISLTSQPVLQNSFTDFQWLELTSGNWLWAVQAQYSGGGGSQVVFSNPLIKESELGALVGIVQGSGAVAISGAVVETAFGEVLTTEQGAYYLSLPAGLHSVTVRAAGYYPLSYDEVEVFPWQNTRQDFHLDPVSITEELLPIPETRLLGIFPNPFAGSTCLTYSLKTPLTVRVEIYNLKGQLVQRLQPQGKAPGTHTTQLFALDSGGRSLPAGVYLCRFQAGSYAHTQKMLLLE
ncbi:MAG: carboxypeptidase regulatory-like domain-containing protein [Candidatus Cloacimonas sp.]|jgi:hypothetical protein|nr:carboxypeptidase regulatory-like domain-containing protein [Candidatus Cloacimonas sp.]